MCVNIEHGILLYTLVTYPGQLLVITWKRAWVLARIKPLAPQLFVQQCVKSNSKETWKLCIAGPVWGEPPVTGGLTLRWRHNELDGVSDHQPHDCLLNRLFGRRSKKTSKLRVTGLCARNSPGTGEFPAQMDSNAENVSIWWRHHVWQSASNGESASMSCRHNYQLKTPLIFNKRHRAMMTSSSENIFRVTGPLWWNSPHKGQWRRAVMFSSTFAWTYGSANNGDAGELRRHRAYYDVTAMYTLHAFASNMDVSHWLLGKHVILQRHSHTLLRN